jgi:hypothetical protein
LFSSEPGGAVEVSVLKLLLDLAQEVPTRGAVCNMIACRAALVVPRVELANDVNFTICHVPDEGARVSFSREDFGSLVAQVVDLKLNGLNAHFICE